MKIRLDTWFRRNFDPEDRPCPNTQRKMAARGDVPGAQMIGRRWWVELDAPETVDPLVKKVLNRYDATPTP